QEEGVIPFGLQRTGFQERHLQVTNLSDRLRRLLGARFKRPDSSSRNVRDQRPTSHPPPGGRDPNLALLITHSRLFRRTKLSTEHLGLRSQRCPLLAQSGHRRVIVKCPLWAKCRHTPASGTYGADAEYVVRILKGVAAGKLPLPRASICQ